MDENDPNKTNNAVSDLLTLIDDEPIEFEGNSGEFDGDSIEEASVSGRRITIVGRLGGMNRREASNLLRSHGAGCGRIRIRAGRLDR